MIWGVVFGFLMFGDLPSSSVVFGSGIVVASGLFIIHRELVLAKQGRLLSASAIELSASAEMPAKAA